MKKVYKILLGILVAVIVILLVAWLTIDHLAKAGIEQGATYALGVNTTVDSVRLGLVSGRAEINDLTIGNPEGFKTPHLMKAARIELGVRPGSLLGDTLQVDRFEIDGLDLNIEQKVGSSNLSALLDNIQRAGGEPSKEPKPAQGRKVQVDRIKVTNVVAHVQVLPIGGSATTLDVKVPEILLEGVTSDNAAGVAVPELVKRLTPAILAAVVDKAKGAIPDADLKRLSGSIASMTQALGDGAGKLVHQVGGNVADALQGLGAGAQKVGESATKGIGDALKGIFGDKKPPDPTQK
jgi:hypothetical protein